MAERKRTQYPVDYEKNKKLKASFVTEEINLAESSSDDEQTTMSPPRQISVDEKNASKSPVIKIHPVEQTTATKRLFSF